MGVVYKALDPTIGRTVAIKAIRLSDFQDADERRRVYERLLREAQSAGLLSHPNIVTIYDVLEEEDSAYIVMEYVGGASLERMLRNRLLPEQGALLRYLQQAANALDYAHRKDIVHRDVKPANIIIADSEEQSGQQAKVADFGVAKFISHDATYSGTMMGTPNYMSPEQIQGLPLDGRADQFSLAVVIYEILTGVKPFAADTLPALFYQICRTEPKSIINLNRTLNGNVDSVVMRALAKEPQARYQTCSELVQALSQALADVPGWMPSSIDHKTPAIAVAAGAMAVASAKPVEDVVKEPQPPPVQELPSLTRRRTDPDESDGVPSEQSGLGKKLVLLFLMGLAITAAIIFIVRWNAGPSVPVQVISPKTVHRTPSMPSTSAQKPPVTAGKLFPESERTRKLRSDTPAAPANPPTAVTTVEFLTEPPGAKITLDNHRETACQAPCTLSLPDGRHTLISELSGFNVAKRIFTVPNDRSLLITLDKSMGVLVVTSTPSGSPVIIDGKDYGQTPVTLHLTTGSHQMLLTNGAQRHEETVVIGNDSFESRSVNW